ncbi:hypothetical protein HHI36_011937 [Cryptolaemus montrouzieri]|uniref:Transposase n=1 Tax=Cryptolaemus montrouzieri TaxID=559131 RepID=A0ABD2ND64_9CUCU
MLYTQNEKVDMLLIYGECLQHQQFYTLNAIQNGNILQGTIFQHWKWKFRQQPVVADNQNFIVSENSEIDVLAYINLNCTASTREIAQEIGISHQSVWRILKKHKFRSFKYNLHQHLYGNFNGRRLEYCNQFLQKMEMDPRYPYKISYSDESRFTNNGMFNRNNTRPRKRAFSTW